MKRLSSYSTLLWKVFPLVWAVGVGIGLFGNWGAYFFTDVSEISLARLIGGTILLIFLTVVAFGLTFPLYRVVLDGNEVIASRFWKTTRTPFHQIEGVDGPDWTTLRRITIRILDSNGKNGTIVFVPRMLQGREIRRLIDREIQRQPG